MAHLTAAPNRAFQGLELQEKGRVCWEFICKTAAQSNEMKSRDIAV